MKISLNWPFWIRFVGEICELDFTHTTPWEKADRTRAFAYKPIIGSSSCALVHVFLTDLKGTGLLLLSHFSIYRKTERFSPWQFTTPQPKNLLRPDRKMNTQFSSYLTTSFGYLRWFFVCLFFCFSWVKESDSFPFHEIIFLCIRICNLQMQLGVKGTTAWGTHVCVHTYVHVLGYMVCVFPALSMSMSVCIFIAVTMFGKILDWDFLVVEIISI